jgi:hypothetical protein
VKKKVLKALKAGGVAALMELTKNQGIIYN